MSFPYNVSDWPTYNLTHGSKANLNRFAEKCYVFSRCRLHCKRNASLLAHHLKEFSNQKQFVNFWPEIAPYLYMLNKFRNILNVIAIS